MSSRKWIAVAAVSFILLPAVSYAQAGRGGAAGRGGRGNAGATPDNSALFASTAPTFPTDDPIIRRIWAMGMDSSHTMQLSQALFDSLGARLMGTPNIKSAQDWLTKMYQSWGISAKEEQYGTWRGWRRGYSHIDLIEPRLRSLEGMMVGYSPGTGKKDLDATTIILPQFADSSEFVRWLPNARGKLVLISAPHLSCRPNDDWVQNAAPESATRAQNAQAAITAQWGGRGGVRGTGYSAALGGGSLGVRLEDAGAAGIVTSRPKDAWGTMEVFETYNVKTPAIALTCEDYGLVYRLTDNNQHPKLRLNLDADLLGEQPVFNVVATVKGSTKPDEYVVLSSHFDSWDGSSGATDNGTGTIMMLDAMRILHQVLPHPSRTIVSGHWSGEEEGEVGSKAFTEDHPEIIRGLQGIFNQDNGTGRVVRMGGGGILNSTEHVNQWFGKIPTEFKKQVSLNLPGGPAGNGSDGYSFTCYGVPTFDLSALSWDYNNITWHTERDTYDKIVFDDLRANATLAAMLVYLASEDPTFISRERVDLVAQARADSITAAARGADAAGGRGGRGGGRGGARTWPTCEKAPRVTNPRLR